MRTPTTTSSTSRDEPPGPRGSRRWRVRSPVIVVAGLALIAAGCGSGDGAAADGASLTTTTIADAPPTSGIPATTRPATPTTTRPIEPTPIPRPACPPPTDDTSSTAPPQVAAALAGPLADRRLTANTLSVSVWIDGWGEVAAVDPDRPLIPASNQKLLTASAALVVLDLDARPTTTVVATGMTNSGIVQGDLVLVGGGDPDLTKAGPRSLDALAALVAGAGITGATGRLVVDETRYDDQRTVSTWPVGTNAEAGAGGLGALIVDRNRGSLDGIGSRNAAAFQDALRAHGVTVTVAGPAAAGLPMPVAGFEVARIDGPTYGELVTQMLHLSDGLVAETIVKEIGRRQLGTGATSVGMQAVRDALTPLCVMLSGVDQDGSGFSYGDARSAREWRRLLQAEQGQPSGAALVDRLPVAGTSGTLAARLTGPATTGNVHAKTGSLSNAKAMSGYLTTAGGRRAVFSILVNGPSTGSAEPAIDALVTTVASLPG